MSMFDALALKAAGWLQQIAHNTGPSEQNRDRFNKRYWRGNPLDGTITDVLETELMLLGAARIISGPPDVFANIAAQSVLWQTPDNPLVFPTNSTKGTILQAGAKNPANPQTLHVNLDAPYYPTTTDRAVDLKALLQWGNGSDKSQALVDIKTGTQLSVICSSITIQGIYTAITGAAGGFPDITVGAAIGNGNRPSNAQPTFTTRIFQLQNGTGVFLSIPNYASSVQVIGINDTTALSAACRLTFLDVAGGNPMGVVTQAADVVQTLTIPSLARVLQVINNSANPADFCVVYNLAL